MPESSSPGTASWPPLWTSASQAFQNAAWRDTRSSSGSSGERAARNGPASPARRDTSPAGHTPTGVSVVRVTGATGPISDVHLASPISTTSSMATSRMSDMVSRAASSPPPAWAAATVSPPPPSSSPSLSSLSLSSLVSSAGARVDGGTKTTAPPSSPGRRDSSAASARVPFGARCTTASVGVGAT
jgi:hypothetical protein